MTVSGFVAVPSGCAPVARGLPVAVDPAGAGFRALALRVRAMGLLDRRPGYYRVKITLTVFAFFAAWALFVMVGNSWTALAVAPLVGVICTQLGFIGHDAGHNQVFGTRRRNRLLGRAVERAYRAELWLVGSQAQRSPCASQRDRPRPRYRRRTRPGLVWRTGKRARPARIVAGALAGAAVLPPHADAKRRHARTRDQAAAAAARSCLGGRSLSAHPARRAVPDGGAVGTVPAQGTGFHRRAAGGLLAVPGHQFRAQPQGDADHRIRNGGRLRPPPGRPLPAISAAAWCTTFLLGGLNYQIEHHLFPSMPRPNLRRVQGLVQDFCAATGLGYSEENFAESFRQIIHHLSDAGAATSRRPD